MIVLYYYEFNAILYRFETTDGEQRLCQNSSELEECKEILNSKLRSKCEEHCYNDCEEQFIEYYIKSSQSLPLLRIKNFSQLDVKKRNQITMKNSLLVNKIKIYHRSLPDTIIKHIPEISFTAYMAQLGGLAGMWLGLSVISIYVNLVNIIIFLYEKLRKSPINRQSNKVDQTSMTQKHVAKLNYWTLIWHSTSHIMFKLI